MPFFALFWLGAQYVHARDLTATGKVPIEGALATNNASPRADSIIIIYADFTALVAVPRLLAKLLLPDGLSAAGDAPLNYEFTGVEAGETVSFAVRIRVDDRGRKQIFAEAIAADESAAIQARNFSLVLNADAAIEEAKTEKGQSQAGRALIIYEN